MILTFFWMKCRTFILLLRSIDDWSTMKEHTGKKILESGTELIFQYGYNGVGIQKILQESEVPKGSFYYYFKSKEDLGLKIIESFSNASMEYMKSFLDDSDYQPKQRILNLFESVKKRYQEESFSKGCLLGNCSVELAAQNSKFAILINNNFGKWKVLFQQAIEEGQKVGSIKRILDSEECADFILNSWEGALVRMKSTKNNQPMDLLVKVVEALL